MIRTTLTALAIAFTAACVGLAAPAFAQDLISIQQLQRSQSGQHSWRRGVATPD